MLTGKQKNITNIEKFLISHILNSRPFAPNHAQTGILLPCQELNIQIVTIVHIHINTQGRILCCKTDQTDRLKDGRTDGQPKKLLHVLRVTRLRKKCTRKTAHELFS